jgi:3-oxoadipate enol-lactonase
VHTAELKNVSLRYEDKGPKEGKPIILLHAFPFNLKMWKPQMAAIPAGYRTIAYDIRGFGGSSLRLPEAPSIENYSDDLFHLMDFLEIKKAILVGLSMGGYITLRAKEKHPERISAMVLADTKTDADSVEAKEKRFKTCEKLESGGLNEFTDTFLAGALGKNTKTENQRLVQDLKQEILANSITGMCAALKMMADRKDTSSALKAHPVPTLFLVGAEDTLTPLEAAQQMQKKHSSGELFVIPKAGHLSNLENPDAFNQHLLSFLGKLK